MWGNDVPDEGLEAPVSKSNSTELLKTLDVLNNIDQQFNDLYDNIVVNLSNYNLHSSAVQKIEVKTLTDELQSLKNGKKANESTDIVDENVQSDIDFLLNNSNANILKSLSTSGIPTERKNKYDTYDEISNVNYIAYRMLKVYVDNILIKNNQTKQFLSISENSLNSQIINGLDKNIVNLHKNFMKTFITYFDIQKKLKDKILPKMLKYGDCYLEIINLSHVNDIIEKDYGIIQENIFVDFNDKAKTDGDRFEINFSYQQCSDNIETLLQESDNVMKIHLDNSDPMSQFKHILKMKSLQEGVILENTEFWDDMQNEKSEEKEAYSLNDISDLNFKNIQDIHMNIIDPHKVVPVEMHGIIYGYIVVEDDDDSNVSEIDVYKRFLNAGSKKNGQNVKNEEAKEITDRITKSIISKLKGVMTKRSTKKIEDLELSEEVETSLKVILYNKIKDNAKLKFRFVTPNRFVHFHTNKDKDPNHGTSIYEPIIQPLKMYSLAMMSSIVSRLSRAAVVRRWIVEAGSKKNHPELIAKLKQDISSKSISFDSLSNIKNMSNIITDYKDFATVSVNGQRYVDMEIVPMHDRGLPVNDMQDLRNELIAATGIPSVYLNIADQADVRETLVNLNIGFANTVSSYQDNIDEGLNKVVSIVFNIILENNGYEETDVVLSNYFKISLNPPVILMLQAAEASISSVANIVGMLNGIQFTIDPQKILEQYIPQIDWKDLKKSGTTYIKEEAKQTLMAPSADQGMGQ